MKKVFFKTHGCSFNHLDTQIMKGNLLKTNEFEIVENSDEADIIVINSCTVKNGSEVKFFKEIRDYSSKNKIVIGAGCVPQAEQSLLSNKLKNIPIIGTNKLFEINRVINNAISNTSNKRDKESKKIHFIDPTFKGRKNEVERLNLEKIRLQKDKVRDNEIIEIIPINEGCLNHCSYCKTKDARGNLFSYSIDSIYEVMKNAVDNGAKEIWLTSQDTACYGFDIGTNLIKLLKKLIQIDGDYRIRIGMGNPNHFKLIIDELLDLIKNEEKIYKFLHIPVQSGDNRILKEMRRTYSVEEYEKIIFKAKLKIPSITISNDIIVAFPTETEKEFKNTLELLERTKINVLNYSRFWLRPKTIAEEIYSKKDFISGDISKKRVLELKNKFEEIAIDNNKKWLGWEGRARIIENGKNRSLILRNDYYKPIYILNEEIKNSKKNKLKIGDIVNVKIKEVTWKDFYGEII